MLGVQRERRSHSMTGHSAARVPLAALTSFVGRKRERCQLEAWLHAGQRLITVLGPPGVGKTRLAREVAQDHVSGSGAGRGLAWVELFGSANADDVLTVTAQALGVVLAGDRDGQPAPEGVAEALAQHGRLLLVLDNAEQVAPALAELLGIWLRRAPDLVCLVTSRIRLRVAGEHSLTLGPLELPAADDRAERLLDCPSVRLFWERARALQPGFSLDGKEAAMVALARRLDGLPLALELAAARTPLLHVEGLLERLDRPRRLLSMAGRSGTAEYPVGLWDAIHMSWELLDADEQRALAECAVFEPGFDLAAAESVLSSGQGGRTALELLEALVDHSLVAPQASSTSVLAPPSPDALLDPSLDGARETPPGSTRRRFHLFNSIRDFASERLAALDPDSQARRRHAAYYAALAERGVDQIDAHRLREGVAQLDAQRANLAGALAHASAPGRALGEADRMRLALGLGALLRRRGTLAESLHHIDLGLCPEGPSSAEEARLQARLQCARARLLCELGRFEESLQALEHAAAHADVVAEERLSICVKVERALALERAGRLGEASQEAAAALVHVREWGYAPQEAELLVCLSRCHIERGEGEEGLALAEAALTILSMQDCPAIEGAACIERVRALGVLGRAVVEGAAVLERAAKAFRRADDRPMVMRSRLYQAALALRSPELTRRILEPLRPTLRRQGALRNIGYADALLARAAADAGRFGEARELLLGARDNVRRANERDLEVLACEMLAALHRATGELGAAEALLRATLAWAGELETGEPLLSLLSSREAARAALDSAQAVRSREEARVLELLQCYLHLERLSDAPSEAAAVDAMLEPLRRYLRVEPGSRQHPWGRRPALEESAVLRFEVRLLEEQLPPRLVARLRAESLDPNARALLVAHDTSWFRPPGGDLVDLGGRPLMGRLLGHLVAARRIRPGAPQPPDTLVQAGWPGERMLSESAAARLHTSIGRLRRAGLGRTLVFCDDGYLLDPEVPLLLVGPTPVPPALTGPPGVGPLSVD
jgi:predicted ATPase/tetratricopeptide (TPR) repeat protein